MSENQFGTLFMVATPIGNLADITYRAVDTLKNSKIIFAEDTRVAHKLLQNYDINTPVNSYHAHSNQSQFDLILKTLVEGDDVSLITDAGTPGISDPGNELVNYILNHEPLINIRSIPGASSVVSALSISGINTQEFLFLGFVPKKKKTAFFKKISDATSAVAYFDSPHRVVKNLEDLSELISDREVFVARELTKMFETHYRGRVDKVLELLKSDKNLKGEFIVVISPHS